MIQADQLKNLPIAVYLTLYPMLGDMPTLDRYDEPHRSSGYGNEFGAGGSYQYMGIYSYGNIKDINFNVGSGFGYGFGFSSGCGICFGSNGISCGLGEINGSGYSIT